MIIFHTSNFQILKKGCPHFEALYLPWTFDGNNRDYLRFMAKVLNGDLYV
jgi:hypothetical protein